MTQVTSWGQYPRVDAQILRPEKSGLSQTIHTTEDTLTPRGLGRSYGDSALGSTLISTEWLDRFVCFDEKTGLLTCDAGVSLGQILETFVPKGWFLPVTPGTKFVSLGGAIASDVHGKNHHIAGSFGDYVQALQLLTGDQQLHCSRDDNSDLFRATCGGMGLTGIITEATIRLRPIKSAFVNQTTIKAANLETLLALYERHADATYSVAWIDCLATGAKLGRSLLSIGEHANCGGLVTHTAGSLAIPRVFPSIILNNLSIQAFNALNFNKASSQSESTVHYDAFFYPLDKIHHWNRMYGRKGFLQYQFVIPIQAGLAGLTEILKTIAESKQGSFLAVLKVFGEKSEGLLSFPTKGYTLALDFKMNRKLLPLLNALDVIVQKYHGRLYLAKDARLSEQFFKASYPQWEQFQQIRKEYEADRKFSSLQSARLGL